MADQLPLSAFIRPIRSKAIRIANPNTGDVVPIPSPQKPSFPASIYTPEEIAQNEARAEKAKTKIKRQVKTAAKNDARGARVLALDGGVSLRNHTSTQRRSPTRSSRSPSRHPPQVSQHEEGGSETAGQSFDIYAPAFVPEALRIINKLDGYGIETMAMKPIDFGTYTRSFVGVDILSPMPGELPSLSAYVGQTKSITPSEYGIYFRFHLEEEVGSQKQENEAYSLFGHEVKICLDPSGQAPANCFFTVPGLRENTPYIEEDDVIQLRQLRYDQVGRPYEMEQWLGRQKQYERSDLSGRVPHPSHPGQAPGWTGIIYHGRVSAVQRKQEQVILRLAGYRVQHLMPTQSISDLYPAKFNVQFPVPEKRYIPMRQALSIVQGVLKDDQSILSGQPGSRPWLQSMLFPIEQDCQVQANLNPGLISRSFLDDELNWEQKKAIESVCSHDYGTLPFLISGPPGTGKTKTLVELAVQLLKNVKEVTHILFCAPSDPAADTIIQRISAHFKPSELLRLNRPSRTFAEVPGAVLPFCYTSGRENKFDLPPFKQLMSYRLVVTTCRDAALLLYARLTNADLYTAEYGLRNSINPYATQPAQVELHWTALLIDESAQAMEPEALIPLCVVAPPPDAKLAFAPLFAMAGDEYQLGPRTSLRSSPLRTSLLARLFARPVYCNHPLARGKTGIAPPPLNRDMLPINRPAFVNLIRNYRSHPAILAIPSALFYADTLEPEAKNTDRLAEWSEWRGRKWPVLFHKNLSEDNIETDGGGWYNIGEARAACAYAASLVGAGLVEQKEVCIMSPFKAQVQCLRKMIREPHYGSLWDIDIGPTEAFQGLERGVVILCTTRSKQRFVGSDTKVDWGIIGLPNKMNVALTRAKFGLIVIGKQDVLALDPNWRAFLGFCMRNGLVADPTTTTHKADADGLDDCSHTEPTRLEKVLMANERDNKESPFWGGSGQDDEMWAGIEGMNVHDDEEYEDDDHEDDEHEYDDEGHENQDEENPRYPQPKGTPGYMLEQFGKLEQAWNDEEP